MADRIRRTHEQRQAELERKLQRVKSERKKMEQARRTRRAVILGTTIEGMAEAGDPEAKKAMDKVLASLTRNQDRKMFDLDPLPDDQPDNQPGANSPAVDPPVDDPLAAALARRKRATGAWKDDKSPAQKEEVAAAIAEVETLTGEVWEKIESGDRPFWGLGVGPGERIRPS
jgi:type IV secretory pathway VirB10-like protein